MNQALHPEISSPVAKVTSSGSSEKIIPLGQNCLAAHYLKALGIKCVSYPFDWVFSSPDIVYKCVEDDFESFLNKSFFHKKLLKNIVGHRLYHKKMFNHRNPLESSDYDYYRRCVDRFRKSMTQSEEVIFFVNLIQDQTERKDWNTGLIGDGNKESYKTPDSYQKVKKLINMRYDVKTKFVFLKLHKQDRFEISSENLGSDVVVNCAHQGPVDGVQLVNPDENFSLSTYLSRVFNLMP